MLYFNAARELGHKPSARAMAQLRALTEYMSPKWGSLASVLMVAATRKWSGQQLPLERLAMRMDCPSLAAEVMLQTRELERVAAGREAEWVARGRHVVVSFVVGGQLGQVSLGDIRARVVAEESKQQRAKRARTALCSEMAEVA